MATWSMGYENRPSSDSGFGGKTLKYKDNLGCVNQRILQSKIPAKATWATIQDLAMALVDRAEDQHHVFIEEIHVDTKNPNVVWVETGS